MKTSLYSIVAAVVMLMNLSSAHATDVLNEFQCKMKIDGQRIAFKRVPSGLAVYPAPPDDLVAEHEGYKFVISYAIYALQTAVYHNDKRILYVDMPVPTTNSSILKVTDGYHIICDHAD